MIFTQSQSQRRGESVPRQMVSESRVDPSLLAVEARRLVAEAEKVGNRLSIVQAVRQIVATKAASPAGSNAPVDPVALAAEARRIVAEAQADGRPMNIINAVKEAMRNRAAPLRTANLQFDPKAVVEAQRLIDARRRSASAANRDRNPGCAWRAARRARHLAATRESFDRLPAKGI